MHRKARAALTMPLLVLGAGGLLEIACRGGGPLDQLDGGFDGEATRQASGRAPANGDACAVETVTIEDNAATENASSGGPGCTSDDECTVRFAGDYCACPSTPRPMLTSRATSFDQGLSGIGQRCTCPLPPCVAPAPAKAGCRESRCVLVDAGE